MADNKTYFGDEIISDLTNSVGTMRLVSIAPQGVPGYVSIEFDLTTGEYLMTLEAMRLGRHRARDFSNALGGILTWADNESWPARDDHNMRLARDRMELKEMKEQEADA